MGTGIHILNFPQEGAIIYEIQKKIWNASFPVWGLCRYKVGCKFLVVAMKAYWAGDFSLVSVVQGEEWRMTPRVPIHVSYDEE